MIDSGMVIPSTFAVLRLISSSYFDTCLDGKATRRGALKDLIHVIRATLHLSSQIINMRFGEMKRRMSTNVARIGILSPVTEADCPLGAVGGASSRPPRHLSIGYCT